MKNRHRLAEERSIAYHSAVAARLCAEPRLLENVRQRVAGTIGEKSRSAPLAEEWAAILSLGLPEICSFLVEDSERARELRQATPFAGMLEPKERWRIWRDVLDGFDAGR